MKTIIAAFAMLAASNAAAAASQFSSEEARATALDFADKLEATYLDPKIGRDYATLLRTRVNAGAYDHFDSPEDFAKAATADVRSIYPDGHLELRIAEEPAGNGGDGPPPDFKPFEEMKWIADGVVYAKWNAFFGEEESMAAANALLGEYSNARAVIFDIRGHHGGGLAEPDVIFSALFDKPVHLVSMRIRQGKGAFMAEAFDSTPSMRRKPAENGVDIWEHWATPAAGGAPLARAKAFVLTDRKTASAAEHFALALKTSARAILVGETTAGAGNFGGMHRIGKRFGAFIAVGQTVDPSTGKGWDVVGIAPHVETPAKEALDKALSMID